MTDVSRLISSILEEAQDQDFFRPADRDRLPERERRQAYAALVRRVGLRYARSTLSNFVVYDEDRQRDAFATVERFGANLVEHVARGDGLVLFGKPGTGKDHLAIALAYIAVLEHGFRVEYLTGAQLFAQARQRIRDGAVDEVEFVEQFRSPHILLLSDPVPAKGEVRQFGVETLQWIIDARYRDQRPTWCTLNVADKADADCKLAEPLIDRLRHGATTIGCDWESYRNRRSKK
jgi:DNA replication protein DnaC